MPEPTSELDLERDTNEGYKGHLLRVSGWDRAAAAEAGRKSGEARRRKAELTPEQRALEAFQAKVGDLTTELLDAALGKNHFEDLSPALQLKALLRALEYGIGKPSGQRQDAPEEPDLPTPQDLFAQET